MLGYAWPGPVDAVPRGNGSSALGDAPIGSHALCVSEPSAPAFGWDHCCGVPVDTEGWRFQGLGDGVGLSGLQFPDSSSRKGTETEIAEKGAHGTSQLLSSCLVSPPSFLPSHSPKLSPVCGEDILTSQGMLCHTEAQGLQPVVDVRFSHRKLKFCRKKRVH